MGLETVKLVMDLEELFQVKISDAAASACITVADLQDVIVGLLKERGQRDSPETRSAVWEGIMAVLKRNGYAVDSIRPESKWIGDITRYG